MKVLGLVVEYNPFHNGHMYHIEKAKQLVNPDVTVVVMSGNFVQRGECAIVDKWVRSDIALEHGIDLVIELPFVYAVQSADYFAYGAMKLLNALQVTDLVFGSENGNINAFTDIAYAIKENQEEYDTLIHSYMHKGFRYPDACNQALSILLNKTVTTPNDLLGLAYVKEVIYNQYPIALHCITRTNHYHSKEIQEISSATAIRIALRNKQDVSHCLPCHNKYQNELQYLDNYFTLLRYKILTTSLQDIKDIHLVEEGLEHLLNKKISTVNTMEEFINALTSKRYTRSRIQRMLIHILMHTTKKDIQEAKDLDYVRILGMNTVGRQHLHAIKKECPLKIIATFSSHQHPALDIEFKATKLYACLLKETNTIVHSEYKNIPIIKK